MSLVEVAELKLKEVQGRVGEVVDFFTIPVGFKSTVYSMLNRFRINNARTLDL